MWHKDTTQTTFLWYDYETWGANPQKDRLAQFAAVRTDMDLNPIAEPINLLCRPAIDTVIDPDSVRITGLSPILLAEQGLLEWDFAQQIHQHMSVAGTCSVGYNSIRFDDECTRYLFYRNLLDPYAREWKNGNSRWDLLDVVRMTKALRPEGIEWPTHDDGSPSFKLEQLTAANGLSHDNAHDAVSDVLATIALAKLIKEKQPKLFDYAFKLRSKHEVRKHIDVENRTPHLHFSGKIPAVEHCLGVEVPLMIHPDRNNEAIVIDIREDPTWLLDHDANTLRQWLYSKTEDLPEGARRPPLKTIHLNRSPMIAPMALLDADTAQRLNLDRKVLQQHQQFVEQQPVLRELALDVFTDGHERATPEDPEHALYAGFIDDHDRNILNRMVADKIKKDRWLDEAHALHDDRLPPLIENVLARNFPEIMTNEQLSAWKQQRKAILSNTNSGQSLTVQQALLKIDELIKETPTDALYDTRKYLNSLLERWFEETSDTSSSTNTENHLPDSGSDSPPETNTDRKAETDEKDLTNQLDLF